MTIHILHLGVNDVPYVEPKSTTPRKVAKGKRQTRRARGTARGSETTTGEVAEYLEGHYHLMEIFYETHEEQINELLLQGLVDTFEAQLQGHAPPTIDPFFGALSKIEDIFKQWIATGEAERSGVPGTPTKAARKRRSLRFKSKTSGGPRPSFYDTGQFQEHFRSWMEQR